MPKSGCTVSPHFPGGSFQLGRCIACQRGSEKWDFLPRDTKAFSAGVDVLLLTCPLTIKAPWESVAS